MVPGESDAFSPTAPPAGGLLARVERLRAAHGLGGALGLVWSRLWMVPAGLPVVGGVSTRLAAATCPPYYGRHRLARFNRRGYVAPTAQIHHPALTLGANVFLGDRVVVYRDEDGGPVELADGVHVNDGVVVQTGSGGRVRIGAGTHVQPRCQFSAYKAAIVVGSAVQTSRNCGFYPYDHGIAPDAPIIEQPLETKGDIVIEDDVWIGFGAVVLSGVRIARGAVVAAGAVVTQDVPEAAIAAGVPARVVGSRGELRYPPASETRRET